MIQTCHLLFCESNFKPGAVDEDFTAEFVAAQECGFTIYVFSYEDLVSEERHRFTTKRIPPSAQLCAMIYRGWMLTPQQYGVLYQDLLAKNYKLINTVEEYTNCHYLPNSLKFIENNTPLTIFQKMEDESSIDRLMQKTKIFDNHPVILKDYVKSEKHNWYTACFVRDASDTTALKSSVEELIKLRGKYLNEGIVVRSFEALNDLTLHSKSGMPLTEEYRLFFCHNTLLAVYDYWEEGTYALERPDTTVFEVIAKSIPSHFFSMDIARKKNGDMIIVELGDGQVAGLPDRAGRHEFYRILMRGVNEKNQVRAK